MIEAGLYLLKVGIQSNWRKPTKHDVERVKGLLDGVSQEDTHNLLMSVVRHTDASAWDIITDAAVNKGWYANTQAGLLADFIDECGLAMELAAWLGKKI
jgi:hypothetical protein